MKLKLFMMLFALSGYAQMPASSSLTVQSIKARAANTNHLEEGHKSFQLPMYYLQGQPRVKNTIEITGTEFKQGPAPHRTDTNSLSSVFGVSTNSIILTNTAVNNRVTQSTDKLACTVKAVRLESETKEAK